MHRNNRLLAERSLDRDHGDKAAAPRLRGRPARSVTVNITESPLGWLFARGHLTQRQLMPESDCGSIMSAGNWRSG